MMGMFKQRKSVSVYRRRLSRGGTLAEFGPALFVLFMVFFFPFLNLLGLALSYADCLYLDFMLLRQAALENVLLLDKSTNPPSFQPDYSCSTDANGSLNKIIQAWRTNGLGQFASTGSVPRQKIWVDLTEGSNKLKYVHLELQVDVRPFLQIPFPIKVPGLNAPVTFNYNGRSVIENIPN